MNKPLFILTLLLYLPICSGAQKRHTVHAVMAPPEPPPMEVFMAARFPGGADALTAYITKNSHYPPVAREANVEGRVIVQFFVNEDGTISDARILRGIGAGCDEEALRVINHMPKWNPASYNGRPTRTIATLLVLFRLE